MRRKEDERIYELFDEFIETVLMEKKDFFDGKADLLTDKNLAGCKEILFNENNDKVQGGDLTEFEKARVRFDDADESVRRLFAHAIWLWGFAVCKKVDLIYIENNTKMPPHGFADPGQYHRANKFNEVSFCIRLFDAILKKNFNSKESVKAYIEKVCLCCAYEDKIKDYIEDYDELKKIDIVKTYSKRVSMIHILLYLSNPNGYERIVSNDHKQEIANCFESLLGKDEKAFCLECRIKRIRDKLAEIIKKPSFDFYDEPDLASLWYLGTGKEDDVDEFDGLKFKKNIIFYGPPGTSKTYSAKQLAKSFILRERLSDGHLTMEKYLKKEYAVENYIYRLQLHANYGYENFIVGQTMIDGKIETVKGYFLELCETAANDKEHHPYVLILDEINRVDLARLFGEAFSCIENRNEPVDLPYKIDGATLRLTVPDNLYIIGTMNEIDFSLERLDFALRRRFLWFKHGYNESVLSLMLTGISDESDKSIFVSRATELNKKIQETPELGEQYEIGHVFFSEIQNIICRYEKKGLYSRKGSEPKEPVETLWKISIRPMLEAYLDNVDVNVKNDILNDLKEIYYGKRS